MGGALSSDEGSVGSSPTGEVPSSVNGAGTSFEGYQGADLAEVLRQEIVAGMLAPGLRVGCANSSAR